MDTESKEDPNDIFNERFHLPDFYTNNHSKSNSKVSKPKKITSHNTNSKHHPPPHHTHNITQTPSNEPHHSPNLKIHNHSDTYTHSSFHSNTTLTTDVTNPNKGRITPDQWQYMKHKMDDIAPFIEAIKSNLKHKTHKGTLLQKHRDSTDDNDNIGIESEMHSDHSSDDDVLNDDMTISINTAQPPLLPNTTSVSTTGNTPVKNVVNSNGHQYKQSMTVTFDPNGYDGVIGALDVLQNFFNINKGNNESDEASNSDDEVLDPEFDKNNNENRDPFDTESENEHSTHDILSNSHNHNTYNKESEYDQLAFEIAHSSVIGSDIGSKNTEQKDEIVHIPMNTLNMNISNKNRNKTNHKKDTKHTHQRVVTPIPVGRLKSINKYRNKVPRTQPNMGMGMQMGTALFQSSKKQKSNPISFSKILSEANRNNHTNNYNITPQSRSDYLMPSNVIINDFDKPLSPSNSAIESQTEFSVDNADEFDYRIMPMGGMKRISQSYQNSALHKASMDNHPLESSMNNPNIILEGHEHEHDSLEHTLDHSHMSPHNHLEHSHSPKVTHTGVILKQPSDSVVSPPVNVRGNSLGLPNAMRSLSDLSGQYRNGTKTNTNNNQRNKTVHNKRYKSIDKMDENDTETAAEAIAHTLITIQSVDTQTHSPNEHQRDHSMFVNIDENSEFQTDFGGSNYTPKSKSKSFAKLGRSNSSNAPGQGRQGSAHSSHGNAYAYHSPPMQYGFTPKHRMKRDNIALDVTELSENESLVQTKSNNENTKNSKTETMEVMDRDNINGMEMTETKTKSYQRHAHTIDNSNMNHRHLPYAIRSNIESNESHTHNHSMVVIHDRNERRNNALKSDSLDSLPLSNNKWTKWILLAALSICFILGVFMGFGVSYIFFGY